MYAALWRAVPGPWPVRVLVLTAVAAGAVAACFLWVFPAAAPHLPFNQQTVEQETAP